MSCLIGIDINSAKYTSPHSSRSVRVARYVRPYLRDLYHRRLLQGPEIYRPRSAWKPWNYDSEVLAFRSRIGEDIDPEILHLCFTDKSFSSYTGQKDTTGVPRDNSALAEAGRRISDSYIRNFLRKFHPRLPEEWIVCVRDRLLSDSELATVGAHLGITDVLQYSMEEERSKDSPMLPEITGPPSTCAIATSFLALVGALADDHRTANLFVRDFILTRLLDLEFCADFAFPLQDKPFALLEGVLRFDNRGPPEPRLQKQSSMNTLLACYQVGIYSDRQLVGEAPGETIEIAEKEAALQALRNLFGIQDNRPPLPLSGPYIPVDGIAPNPSLKDYLGAAAVKSQPDPQLFLA
ncbi:39S ribosomal protein L44 mitochondrial [Taenia crassiceps]|uniref:Large ribosomal subunit protein mL44 n=1 Tax=Taenia crassiceps TaxID=6207 RepID=A0ABR4QK23_9CEST